VWVGRDDNKSLGKNVSGGTTPAQIWRGFMAPALGIDGRSAAALPAGYRVPRRPPGTPAPGRPVMDSVEEWFEQMATMADELMTEAR
jgi:membrane carboxypeptidase/penicillin-binding protein